MKIVIATHHGKFHADEVTAIAILKLVYGKIKVIRTRDWKKLKEADIRVDVGRNYNPETKDFDHHQEEFKEKRVNGVPYASAGLIWKHFGDQLANSKESFEQIDKTVTQQIDAEDNGVDLFKTAKIKPYTIHDMILSFTPRWKEKDPDYDKAFESAVEFVEKLLKKEIVLANEAEEAQKFVDEEVAMSNGSYVIFDKEPFGWREFMIKHPKIKFVIYLGADGNWRSEATRVKGGSFRLHHPFPQKWADLTNEKLQEITGVEDSVFCHKFRFVVVAKTKEGAIKLTETALKHKR